MKVMYNSRLQVENLKEKIRQTGSFHQYSFAQKKDPCMSIFGKIISVFQPMDKLTKDNLNVNVTVSANLPGLNSNRTIEEQEQSMRESGVRTLHVKTDTFHLKELHPETLEPIGIADQSVLHPLLDGPLSAAHAKSDPVTGDVFNFNVNLIGRYPTYRIFRVSAKTGKTDVLATIAGPGIHAAYLHSFFLTKDFVVLCIWNSHLANEGMRVLWEKNMLDAISRFDSLQPAKWLVIDRKSGRGLVAEFESPAFFAFHTINAWQQQATDGKVDIVCDIVEYPDLSILHKFYYDVMMSTSPKAEQFKIEKSELCKSTLARYVLRGVEAKAFNRTAGSFPLAERILAIPAGDIPTFNENYVLKPNRYIYMVVDRGLSSLFDGLAKFDTETSTTIFWDNPYGHTPGEAIFVPDPDGKEEDNGILLSVVLDGFSEQSYMLCLDARTMLEMGRAQCSWVIPFGFHGQHVSRSRNILHL